MSKIMDRDEFIAWLKGLIKNKPNLNESDTTEIRSNLKDIQDNWLLNPDAQSNWEVYVSSCKDLKDCEVDKGTSGVCPKCGFNKNINVTFTKN